MNARITLLTLFLIGTITASAEPRISSWFTDRSGVYARIYQTPAQQTAQTPVTTWTNGNQTQNPATYAGIHEISYTGDWVYIRTTGLGSHIMGPWQNGNFPNLPANQAALWRLPLIPPPVPATRVLTGLGAIGYFVDGVAMFDSRDAFSYDHSQGVDETPMTAQDPAFDGDGIWNRDAYVNEGPTFDAANAHQAGPTYHYHANPPALRHSLGDSVDYNPATNVYTENFNGNHSPIIGWCPDGYPVYGPYGFDDPNNAASPVTRMLSGFQPRDGSNGSANLPVAGRTTYPAWATRTYVHAFQSGPNVNATYPLGHYLEDYAYKGDLGLTQGTVVTGSDDFHLDEFNGRLCVTPEFPGGTYAYFTAILPDGTPTYPYNIGRRFYGDPVGGAVGAIPAPGDAGPATTHFEGGPEKEETVESLSVDDPAPGDVTLVWSGVEGATYEINGSTDLGATSLWTPVAPAAVAPFDMLSGTHSGVASTNDFYYYRVNRTNLAAFDDAGFDYPGIPGGPTPTFTAFFPTAPPLPPQNAINSITVGGVTATIVSYDQGTGVVELNFDDSSLAPGSYNAILNFSPGGTPTDVFSTNQYTVLAADPENILVLIIDDWGLDASPLDNTEPGVLLANMPNLANLAAGGLRFTRAYVNPACSPTRASLMTGRYAHQTGVYTPQEAGSFSVAETALPEAMTAAGSPYTMASMGKWHLGGNNNGYSARGGWDEFYGINGGGVQDYFSWTKNTNGTTAVTTTYSTTDQVNEAVAFIGREETADNPWLCWVAFNAPHTPFHEPPTGLEPTSGGGYTNEGLTDNQSLYTRMQEALDTEIGRLFSEVDGIDSAILQNTNIILIGDNGTPNQVVQAPFGNGNAKGDLYNGGIHVPMVFKGPAFTGTPGTTTDKLVHAVDLFASILELAGLDPQDPSLPQTARDQSTSIVPILSGTDTADRCMVAEGGTGGNRGRAIIVDDFPQYKLIIFGDPESTFDTPTFEFYNIGAPANDVNEQSPLNIAGLTGTALDAYNACIAKDTALGGGYSDPPSGGDTLYIELFDPAGPPPVPQLVNGQGNPIDPTSIVVDGVTATYVARVNSGPSLADEADDVADRFWVKCVVPINPPYNDATVTFTIQGTDRVFNETDPILVKP